MIDGETLIVDVLVRNDLGMHARPAALLAREAQKFAAEVYLVSDGQEVDAKSILDILTLAAAKGASLQIKARGNDAAQAVDRLVEIFRNGFGEQ